MQRIGQTGYVILGLLSIQPNLSGYDMRKAVQQSVGHFWGESYGQIYPALRQLVAEKLIEPAHGTPGQRKRQEYRITKAGEDHLHHWLALPFHNDPPRNEFLLKLFFGLQATPAVALEHVKDLQQRNTSMLETLKKIEASVPQDEPPNPNLPYWMLTLSLGRALTMAALEWGEHAMKTLSDLDSAAPPGRPHHAGSRIPRGGSAAKET